MTADTWVAVIEWHADDAESPAVLVGATLAEVEVMVVNHFQSRDPRDLEITDDRTFLNRHPLPPVQDPQAPHDLRAVQNWLDLLHEATTVPWVTTYVAADGRGTGIVHNTR